MLLKIVASCGFSGWHILQSVVWEGLDVITALHSTIRGKKRAKGNNKWKTKSSETSSIFHPARPHHPLETWRIKHMPIASKTSKAFIYFVLSWKSEGLWISRFQVQAGWKDDRMKEWQDEVPKVWHLKLCWPTHRVNSLTFPNCEKGQYPVVWFSIFSTHTNVRLFTKRFRLQKVPILNYICAYLCSPLSFYDIRYAPKVLYISKFTNTRSISSIFQYLWCCPKLSFLLWNWKRKF